MVSMTASPLDDRKCASVPRQAGTSIPANGPGFYNWLPSKLIEDLNPDSVLPHVDGCMHTCASILRIFPVHERSYGRTFGNRSVGATNLLAFFPQSCRGCVECLSYELYAFGVPARIQVRSSDCAL